MLLRSDRLEAGAPPALDDVVDACDRGEGEDGHPHPATHVRCNNRAIHPEYGCGTAGRLQLHLFGALAEFERELIRERTRAGLEAARARGRRGGRPTKVTPDKLAALRRELIRHEFWAQAHPMTTNPELTQPQSPSALAAA
jgi:hypothetical protein